MKMNSTEFNKFHTMKETACGAEIILRILEEYPSKLNDDEVRTLATAIKNMVGVVADFMQSEVARQEAE